MTLQLSKDSFSDLRVHQHVRQVQEIGSGAINILYSPSETNSVYKDNIYRIQITLSQDYPMTAPKICFIDPIYHLNVSPHTRQVRMGILQEEWSPFLSLVSIVQSLDRIMQKPQQDYPTDSDLLYEYLYNKQQYLKHVIDFDKQKSLAASRTSFIQASNSPNQKINPVINQFKENLYIDKGKESIYQNKQDEYSPQIQSSSNKISQNYREYSSEKTKQINFQSNQIKFVSKQKIKNAQPIYQTNPNNSLSKFPQLKSIAKTLDTFVTELNESQEQIELTKNQSIKKILIKSRDEQIKMIEQLLSMSYESKTKLLQKLRNQIKDYQW